MPRASTLEPVGTVLKTLPLPVLTETLDRPFRILVTGDFSGGLGRNRLPIEVDHNNFGQVMALLAPQLHVPIGATEYALSFRSLDDFTPAGLSQRMMNRTLRAGAGAPPFDPEALSETFPGSPSASHVRAIMHDPAFQSLEAIWRGLDFLLNRVRTGENLKVYLLDLPLLELEVGGLGDLSRALAQEDWGAIAGMYEFDRTAETTLARIAAMAQDAEAPFLTGLTSETAQLAELFPDMRTSLKACWIGLAAPRFLIRLPYAEAEAGDSLWGHPAFVCACLLAQAFERNGWSMRPGDINEIGGLPAVNTCTELPLTEQAAAALADRGIMSLVAAGDAGRIRLVRFQSVAQPHAPLAGKWD
jgi:hypothetical protein